MLYNIWHIIEPERDMPMPRNTAHSKTRGFTIIEVVLVLAIAGLIFLMVFIALPALRASQRDAQRRNDSTIIAAAVRSYMKNNHGNVPKATSLKTESKMEDGVRKDTYVANDIAGTTFSKYLTDLDAGGVTDLVTIMNNSNDKTIQKVGITGASDSRAKSNYGHVWIITRVKCPEAGNEIPYDVTTTYFVYTSYRSDVVIVRFLEKGGWYCLEV